MLLYYVRHGDPIYDPDSLTPLGARQAEAVGRRLSQVDIDEIYASSAGRAQMTAKPLCEMLRKEMIILDWAHEHYAWEQLTAPYGDRGRRWLFQHPDLKPVMVSEEVRRLGRRWYDHPAFKDTAARAGIERVQREADNWLAGFGYHHDLEKNMYYSDGGNAKRIALFAHQGFGLTFLSCVLDIPFAQFSVHVDIQHSGVSVIDFPEEEGWVIPRLLQLSSDAHIYSESLPMIYNHEKRV